MGSPPRRPAAAAAAAVLALALVACDDEPEPTPEPTAPSSTAVSETSTPTEPTPTGPVEPTLPAAAEEATKAGAEAFVEYYVALINYAQKTGDVATLTDIAEPACEGCRAGTDSIAEIYRRGGRITGGAYEVRRLETSRATKESWTVIAHLRVGDQTVRGAGDLDQTYPGGRSKLLFGTWHRAGRWTVSTLETP